MSKSRLDRRRARQVEEYNAEVRAFVLDVDEFIDTCQEMMEAAADPAIPRADRPVHIGNQSFTLADPTIGRMIFALHRRHGDGTITSAAIWHRYISLAMVFETGKYEAFRIGSHIDTRVIRRAATAPLLDNLEFDLPKLFEDLTPNQSGSA